MQVNFQNDQRDFQQNESDEEYEIIEIYEKDRYDDNELYPCNLNFVLQGKSNPYFFTQNQDKYQSLFNQQNISSYNYAKQQFNKQNNTQFCPPSLYPPNISFKQDNLSNNQNKNVGEESGRKPEVINKLNISHNKILTENQNNILNQIPQTLPKNDSLNKYFPLNQQQNINNDIVPTYISKNEQKNNNLNFNQNDNQNINSNCNLNSLSVISKPQIPEENQNLINNKSINNQVLLNEHQNLIKNENKNFESDKIETKVNMILPKEQIISTEEKENLKDAVIKTIVNPDGSTSTVLQKTYIKYITKNEPININENIIQNNSGQNLDNSKDNISYLKQEYTTQKKEEEPNENDNIQNISLNKMNKNHYEVESQKFDEPINQINENKNEINLNDDKNMIQNNPTVEKNIVNPQKNIPSQNIIPNNQVIIQNTQNNIENCKNNIPNPNIIENNQNINLEQPNKNDIITEKQDNNITFNNQEQENMNHRNQNKDEDIITNSQQINYNEKNQNKDEDIITNSQQINYNENKENNQIDNNINNNNQNSIQKNVNHPSEDIENINSQIQNQNNSNKEELKEENKNKMNYNNEKENINDDKLLKEENDNYEKEGCMNYNEVEKGINDKNKNENKIDKNEENFYNQNNSSYKENILKKMNKKENEYTHENEDEINDYEYINQSQLEEENNRKPPTQKEQKLEKKEKEIKKNEKEKKKINYRQNNNIPKEEQKYSKSSFKPSTKEKKSYNSKTNVIQPKDKKISNNNLFDQSNNSKNENKEDLLINKIRTKNNIRQTEELKFNPKKPKTKPIEPLFSKYEQLEGQTQYNNLENNTIIEPIFKKSKEIFPSQFGVEMPYKSKIRESLYYKSNTYQNDKTSMKKEKQKGKNDEKELDFIKKNEKTNYYTYKNNIKIDNPFKGSSKIQISNKERKNQIAKTVEKEENEFYDIILIEEKIANNNDLKEEEINQLISSFNQFLYKGYSKDEELRGYEYKINKIGNILKIMGIEEQNKILENLKENADNKFKNEMLSKLKSSIEAYNKNKKIKNNKKENIDEKEENDIQVKSSKKKVLKKSIK